MKNILHILILLLITLALVSCSNNSKEKGSPEYLTEVNEWVNKRIERLKTEDGWLTLVGLYWLKEGENTFGSSNSNDIVFPDDDPENIGTITLIDSVIKFKSNQNVIVTNIGNKIEEIELKHDLTEEPTILQTGSFKWYIIKRGEKYGVRLRDINSPLLKEFTTIERFPTNEDWKFDARFEEYNPPKIISLPTQLGTVEEEKSPGVVVFSINGIEYKLDAIDTGNRFWFLFADETNGEETYGAGRYIYTDKPDSNGIVVLDFNLAYNPPCVFTKYATCSFAPKQNHLQLNVTAGEKMWGDYH